MSDELLVKHCSPTLAGLKTANMYTCPCSSKTEMNEFLRKWNRTFSSKGIRIVALRYNGERALIYVYRPAKLSIDLQDTLATELLTQRGYCTNSCGACIMHLIKRLQMQEEFPHEIGLFLGYPSIDVCGFIQNKSKGCKCVGCWKVYGDEQAASRTFAKYKKCTDVYCNQFAKGKSIERLTVAG